MISDKKNITYICLHNDNVLGEIFFTYFHYMFIHSTIKSFQTTHFLGCVFHLFRYLKKR